MLNYLVRKSIPLFACLLLGSALKPCTTNADDSRIIPVVSLRSPEPSQSDQDDLCFWWNQAHPERSLILVSDKRAQRIISYDLEGHHKQKLPTGKPGNIDLRQSVQWNGTTIDLVAWNQREPDFRIRVAKADRITGHLEFIDGGGILTAPNYGGTLYRSPNTGTIYFICTTQGDSEVVQYQLHLLGPIVTGRKVRGWKLSASEGAVADDAAQVLYIAEENRGIWKVGAEPEAATPGELVLKVGEHGLAADLEGITIAVTGAKSGHLLVSSQGNSTFFAFDRQAPHGLQGRFQIQGALFSDGIDVLPIGLGTRFPGGLFGTHTEMEGHPILLSRWEDIARRLTGSTSK